MAARRARHRPGRDPQAELHPARARSRSRPSPARTTTSASTRRRSTRRAASPATTSCGAEQAQRARARRREAARHRRVAPTSRSPPAGCSRSSARSRSHADGTVTATVGTSAHGQGHETAFAMIVAELLGVPMDARAARAVRHRARPARHRHDGIALAADRRAARVHKASERGAREGQAPRRAPARGERRRHRASTTADGRRRRRPGYRALAGRSSRSAADRPGRRPADWEEAPRGRARLQPGRRDLPVRRAHRGRRGRHRDRARSSSLRHVAVDDCGRILNPLLVAGQQHGGIAQGVAQALYEGVVVRRRRQPADRQPHGLRDAERGRAPELRSVEHRDADAAQPARRQGHRRVGHDRLDAGGAERGRRRAVATSGSATSTCRSRPSACGGRSATPPQRPAELHGLRVPDAPAHGRRSTARSSRHCYDGLPDEACGLLGGPDVGDGEPTGVVSAGRTRAATPTRRRCTYTVDGRDDLRAAMRDADERGDEIVGVLALAHAHRRLPVADRRASRPSTRSGSTCS